MFFSLFKSTKLHDGDDLYYLFPAGFDDQIAANEEDSLNGGFYLLAIENRQRSKYQALVIKGIQFPKWLADKEFAETNAISNISYVSVPYNSIVDSTIKVSNDEVATYLKDNAAAYQVDETSRNISFVVFSAAPSSSDSVNVYNQVASLKSDFKNASDVTSYLTR